MAKTQTPYSVESPTFEDVANGLAAGVYSGAKLNPPGGDDCTHLLVRDDGSLGWCYADGHQHADYRGYVSRFSAAELCDNESKP